MTDINQDTPAEVVTGEHVREAEREAAEAAALVVALEEAVAAGDETVTIDQITEQENLSRYARLRAEATRRKADAAKAAARVKAVAELKSDILKGAKRSSRRLTEALLAAEAAAHEFYTLANEYDDQLAGWVLRLEQLGIINQVKEQGIGLNGIGEVTVGHLTLEKVDGGRHLNKLFVGQADPYGRLEPHRGENRDATFRLLSQIGQGL